MLPLRERGSSDSPEAHAINQLIASLPVKEQRRILQLGKTVDLVDGAVLCEVDEPLQNVYFPLSGLIWLLAISRDHEPLGLAMIGNEGLVGSTLALGIKTPRLRAVVHGPAVALRVTAPQLRRLLRTNPGLSRTLQRYCYVLMGQFFQTAACNSFHQVEKRLARWLLMTNDRGLTDQYPLTHQMLADLLGVQRSAITIAAGKLQRKKLISYARGHVNVLSRSGLEAACCECYGMRAGDHARQFAP